MIENKSSDDEMKLLADFAIKLDKKNQVLKKLLEQKSTPQHKKL